MINGCGCIIPRVKLKFQNKMEFIFDAPWVVREYIYMLSENTYHSIHIWPLVKKKYQ